MVRRDLAQNANLFHRTTCNFLSIASASAIRSDLNDLAGDEIAKGVVIAIDQKQFVQS